MKGEEVFKDWTREELIRMLTGSWESNSKIMTWLYKNHLEVLREYEDKELGGLHLHLLE